uniref:Uncharacterized protein n=1 Tax=Auxenochlorella protothecoides TaxID=3075 RepID=A0A1D2AFG0_AUXPR
MPAMGQGGEVSLSGRAQSLGRAAGGGPALPHRNTSSHACHPPRRWTGIKKRLAALPSAVFEASTPTRPYTVLGRLGCLGVKALEYSLAGFACGLVGQGVANSLMIVKRKYQGAREDDVAVPPLIGTALVWGLFMGVSSNVRYQTVFGLERLVELTIARRFPPIAYGTTVAIRFANNVIGGEQFVDLARWAGVQ